MRSSIVELNMFTVWDQVHYRIKSVWDQALLNKTCLQFEIKSIVELKVFEIKYIVELSVSTVEIKYIKSVYTMWDQAW